jgi:hypothetical protein
LRAYHPGVGSASSFERVSGETIMTAATAATPRAARPTFYVWMAGACALIAFGGFAPTYWLQIPAGTFNGRPILYLHGTLFSIWMVFYIAQTAAVASGRIARHRAWGIVGVSIATAMVLLGFGAALDSLRHGIATGHGDAVKAFLVVPLVSIVTFAGFFAAAVGYNRRAEIHKRLMLAANVAILPAAVARVFFVLQTGGGPGMRPGVGAPPPVQIAMVPALLCQLLLVAGMIYDWRTRGRPHPAYLISLAILLAVTFLFEPISRSPGWIAFATAFAGVLA